MGHATRCIPIINGLLKANYEPIIASDGNALLLLQKEFPLLKSIKLPSYNIKYSKTGRNLKFKLLLSVPSVISAVNKEHKIIAQIINKENIAGIISDNRFGVYNSKIPSVYVTHQLNVLSGNTTGITSRTHQKIIKNFNECWVPDFEDDQNFSGNLSHLEKHNFNLKYIGILSRLKSVKCKIENNLLVLLSGPEPQRTLLEEKVLEALKNYSGKVLFVRGTLNNNSKLEASNPPTGQSGNIKIINFLLTTDLEKAIIKSEIVIARSGYSTIMDLAVLGKKAFFIPTPGQFEQEYLAELMQNKLIAPFSNQKEFNLERLTSLINYKGFEKSESKIDLKLFQLFEGK
ncbi:glycosyltransferase [Lutibacter flavus]|uniref:glycosyltransferase n=1 Tax=Lutibacter flavus TaxID=691689 RepID=UPI0026D3A6F4|nr:glycosyltransferase [Lutibacter flavus]